MARKRTKSGRFAKSRSRSVKRRTYSVRARRRNPASKYGPSTKRGGRRVTARRAYMKTAAPRRRRRNQKGFLENPAVRYGIAASVGFFGAAWADNAPWLNPTKADGTALLPFGLRGSLLGAVALGVLSRYALKGRNRQYGYAAAVGMAAPSAIGLIDNVLPRGAVAGGAMHNMLPGNNNARALSNNARTTRAAAQFVKASANIDNQAA